MSKSIDPLINKLKTMDACLVGIEWVASKHTLQDAYKICERADWLLWFSARVDIDCKVLVSAACDCAATALKYAKKGDDSPRIAIETARAWVNGKTTICEVIIAADAAYAAASAAYSVAYAASYAAYSSAYAASYAAAASAASSVADAAASSVTAYAAASVTASIAASAAAYAKHQKRMAELVKKRISFNQLEKAMNKSMGI